MALQGGGPQLGTKFIDQPRRAFDIGEQKRDRSGRRPPLPPRFAGGPICFQIRRPGRHVDDYVTTLPSKRQSVLF
jgi:hypothetical protein